MRNRNLAPSLAAWPADRVPVEARDAVRRALAVEPDKGVRERLRGLLAGWPT